jgi:hypothetical protein
VKKFRVKEREAKQFKPDYASVLRVIPVFCLLGLLSFTPVRENIKLFEAKQIKSETLFFADFCRLRYKGPLINHEPSRT